jgi:hypothetical protein
MSIDKIIVQRDVSTSLCRGILPQDVAQKVFSICQFSYYMHGCQTPANQKKFLYKISHRHIDS